MLYRSAIAMYKAMFREFKLITHAKVFGYHKSIDTLPVYNWFKCEENELNYICKRRIKGYPKFFKRVFREMHFEFDNMDNSGIRDIAKLAYLDSLVSTAKTPAQKAKFTNMRNFKEAELRTKAKTKHKRRKLNDLINIIEETNKQIGAIDVHKMTTSRFFSLLNRSIDKTKVKQHVNN